jgi:Fe-S cluster assembly protein SufD
LAEALAEAPQWLVERRREGASLAQSLSLPGPKDKGWEFTDLSALAEDSFKAANPTIVISGQNGTGSVGPLEEAVAGGEGDTVQAQLGSLVTSEDPFVARNDAAWQRGTLVHVPANTVLDTPVRIDVKAPEGGASASRTLIVLEDGAEADVVETWTGGAGGLLNSVVEIRVGAGARLRYSTLQHLDESAWVFATQRAEVGRDASIDWIALGFGSGRGKVRMETNLAGQGAEGRVTGAYAGRGEQHIDYDTTQEHAAPHTVSDLAFRGILGDSSTAVWRGMIRVDPGAQQTDAFQESRNLLLTKQAHADAIPGLEIEANDVRCTHAAAVAQIDAEQLYYLRSRGLPDEDARRLVIEGFLAALVERVGESTREEIGLALEQRLEEVLG